MSRHGAHVLVSAPTAQRQAMRERLTEQHAVVLELLGRGGGSLTAVRTLPVAIAPPECRVRSSLARATRPAAELTSSSASGGLYGGALSFDADVAVPDHLAHLGHLGAHEGIEFLRRRG